VLEARDWMPCSTVLCAPRETFLRADRLKTRNDHRGSTDCLQSAHSAPIFAPASIRYSSAPVDLGHTGRQLDPKRQQSAQASHECLPILRLADEAYERPFYRPEGHIVQVSTPNKCAF